jgi:hypothetical protein
VKLERLFGVRAHSRASIAAIHLENRITEQHPLERPRSRSCQDRREKRGPRDREAERHTDRFVPGQESSSPLHPAPPAGLQPPVCRDGEGLGVKKTRQRVCVWGGTPCLSTDAARKQRMTVGHHLAGPDRLHKRGDSPCPRPVRRTFGRRPTSEGFESLAYRQAKCLRPTPPLPAASPRSGRSGCSGCPAPRPAGACRPRPRPRS